MEGWRQGPECQAQESTPEPAGEWQEWLDLSALRSAESAQTQLTCTGSREDLRNPRCVRKLLPSYLLFLPSSSRICRAEAKHHTLTSSRSSHLLCHLPRGSWDLAAMWDPQAWMRRQTLQRSAQKQEVPILTPNKDVQWPDKPPHRETGGHREGRHQKPGSLWVQTLVHTLPPTVSWHLSSLRFFLQHWD